MNDKVFIIAEAGVNHNGSIEMAKKLISVAKNAGADAIKFQSFKASNLVTEDAPMANYQVENTGRKQSQFEMLKELELSKEDHITLFEECQRVGIKFLSTPFDSESIALLKILGVSTFKIPSGEITNTPYLREIAKIAKDVILSTGMANLEEVKLAFQTLLKAGKSLTRENITVLHASTVYPCPLNEVNLKAMLTIERALECKVGYSDHTQGILVPVTAASMGASVIEKHFTLDRSLPGPDHISSLEPQELKEMVLQIRNVETILGNGEKVPSQAEIENISAVRKSIVSKRPIFKGDTFSIENLTTMRPGTGLDPSLFWDKIIGTSALRNYEKNELIEAEAKE